jgi:thioredoxin 1
MAEQLQDKINYRYGVEMVNQPVHVTDAAFEKAVLKSTLPVIVDFWAPWCGPCRMVAPILDKLAKEMAGKVVIAKVNTDDNPEWAMRYGVQGIPTMLFVAGGKIVHRQVGAMPEPALRQILTQFLQVVEQSRTTTAAQA